jgi:hypothetical protein
MFWIFQKKKIAIYKVYANECGGTTHGARTISINKQIKIIAKYFKEHLRGSSC